MPLSPAAAHPMLYTYTGLTYETCHIQRQASDEWPGFWGTMTRTLPVDLRTVAVLQWLDTLPTDTTLCTTCGTYRLYMYHLMGLTGLP